MLGQGLRAKRTHLSSMVQEASNDSIVCHIYFNSLTMKTVPWLGLQEPQALAPQLSLSFPGLSSTFKKFYYRMQSAL